MRMLIPLSTKWSWPRPSLTPDFAGHVFDDFDRIVDDFLRPTYANTVNVQPTYDVHQSKDHYLVSLDVPGVKKEDLKIEAQGNQLTISGERQREVIPEEGEANLRHERVYGEFERTFVLPISINIEKIEAHYENGVLNVAIPKAETAKGRTIQIQSGQGGFFSKLLNSKKEGTKQLKDANAS